MPESDLLGHSELNVSMARGPWTSVITIVTTIGQQKNIKVS